ncbi:MAG: hypothetical protein ACI8SN_000442 [Algoriphagus sp.]|jgi:hypothetical protein
MAQETPFLKLNIHKNFLNQKIDFLEGPKVLSKMEIQTLMSQATPETADLYRKSVSTQQIANIFSIGAFASVIGTTVYIVAPHQQSSQMSNLTWPLLISSMAFEIGSGIFNRSARNIARKAVDSYNFGRKDQPVYFEENRIDQPLFSHVIRF